MQGNTKSRSANHTHESYTHETYPESYPRIIPPIVKHPGLGTVFWDIPKYWEVSQNCIAFDVVKFKYWGSLADLFRFWRCQVQKLRKSRRIGSFSTLTSWPRWPAAAWKMGHKQWCTPRDCQLGKDTMDRVCLFWPRRPAAAPRTWDTCSEAHRVKPMALVWLLRNGLTACQTFFLAVLPFWMLVLDVCLPFSYLSFLTVRSHGCCLFAPQRQGKKWLSCVHPRDRARAMSHIFKFCKLLHNWNQGSVRSVSCLWKCYLLACCRTVEMDRCRTRYSWMGEMLRSLNW